MCVFVLLMLQVVPPFDMAFKQKLVDAFEFSFYLSTINGEPDEG